MIDVSRYENRSKGTWSVRSHKNNFLTIRAEGTDHEAMVCRLEHRNDVDEDLANMNLIADAPKLLARVLELEELVRRFGIGGDK